MLPVKDQLCACTGKPVPRDSEAKAKADLRLTFHAFIGIPF